MKWTDCYPERLREAETSSTYCLMTQNSEKSDLLVVLIPSQTSETSLNKLLRCIRFSLVFFIEVFHHPRCPFKETKHTSVCAVVSHRREGTTSPNQLGDLSRVSNLFMSHDLSLELLGYLALVEPEMTQLLLPATMQGQQSRLLQKMGTDMH